MLTIRPEQFVVFRQSARDDYLDYLARYFTNLYPELNWQETSTQFRARLERVIDGARGYGITGQKSTLTFAWLTLVLGEAFERQTGREWAAAILGSRRLTQNAKMAWLVRGLDCGLPAGC